MKQFKQQYSSTEPTIGVLPTYEMLMVLQDPPELGIIIDDPFQRLRCQDAAGRLRHQHAHAHLLHERLYTRGQADGRVLMNAHRDPSVHHPAEKPSDGEHEPAPGWLPLAQELSSAHVVHRYGLHSGRDAVIRQRPTEHQADRALHLEPGASAVHDTEPLRLSGDADESPAHQGGQSAHSLRWERSALPRAFTHDPPHVLLRPRELLQLR